MSWRKITKSTLSRNSRKKHNLTGEKVLHVLDRPCYEVKRKVTLKRRQYQQKIKKNTTLKMLKQKRIPLYKVPLATVRVTLHALKWTFILILLYVCLAFIVLPMSNGMESIRNVIFYGFIGFITFFMAYFGWMLARNVIDIVNAFKIHREEIE